MFSEPFEEEIYDLNNEIGRLKRWIADLQSGMYVNCVYCGHRYGPGETTPVSMASALKAHVEVCPEHPLAALRKKASTAILMIENGQHEDAVRLLSEELKGKT
jgi:hypothetical protein